MEQLNLPKSLRLIELLFISKALEETRNHTEAAKMLGINRTTLLEKMRRYGFALGLPSGYKKK